MWLLSVYSLSLYALAPRTPFTVSLWPRRCLSLPSPTLFTWQEFWLPFLPSRHAPLLPACLAFLSHSWELHPLPTCIHCQVSGRHRSGPIIPLCGHSFSHLQSSTILGCTNSWRGRGGLLLGYYTLCLPSWLAIVRLIVFCFFLFVFNSIVVPYLLHNKDYQNLYTVCISICLGPSLFFTHTGQERSTTPHAILYWWKNPPI